MPDIRDLNTAEDYIRLRRENREMQARIDALKKENAELRKKTEALDMLEEMNEVNLLRFGNKFFVSSYRMFSNVKQPYKASDDNLSTAIRAAYQAWKEVKE